MRRLGVAMGHKSETFYGLAGIGDLIVTATSEHSRNNRCGQLIGKGYSVEDAVAEVGMVVEGLNALPAVLKLAEQYNVELPISSALGKVVYEGAEAKEIGHSLMTRTRKSERG